MKSIIHKIVTLFAAIVMTISFVITGLIEVYVWLEEQWIKLRSKY